MFVSPAYEERDTGTMNLDYPINFQSLLFWLSRNFILEKCLELGLWIFHPGHCTDWDRTHCSWFWLINTIIVEYISLVHFNLINKWEIIQLYKYVAKAVCLFLHVSVSLSTTSWPMCNSRKFIFRTVCKKHFIKR